MGYVSPDPVLAAKDQLDDARSDLRGAQWYYVWRTLLSAIAPLLIPVWVYLYNYAGWFWGEWDHDAIESNGGGPLLVAILITALVGSGVFVCCWADTKKKWPRLDIPKDNVRGAKRRLRDAKAARKVAKNDSVRLKAEKLASEKLAQKMVDEWQPPEGWTPK